MFGRTGSRVAQLALGTGNFGTGWGYFAEAATSHTIFNADADAGGNFIDTADVYQFGAIEVAARIAAGRAARKLRSRQQGDLALDVRRPHGGRQNGQNRVLT